MSTNLQDLKLYYSPGACSLAVHVCLEAIGAKYQLMEINLNDGKNLEKDYLGVNPRARVPVLFNGPNRIREAVGILCYLSEIFPDSNLMPTDTIERAKCYEWLLFGTATIHPFYGGLWRSERFSSDKGCHQNLQETCERSLIDCYSELDEFFGAKKFLLGDRPYICDFYFLPLLRWVNVVPGGRDQFQNLPRYYTNLLGLKPVQDALAQENLAP